MLRIRIKDRKMTAKEIQWHQERLDEFEKMLKSKAIKESRAKKDLEEIQENFLEVFKKLYKTSKYFKHAVDNLTPVTDLPHLVEEFQQDGMKITDLHKNIIEWNQRKLFYGRGTPTFLRTFTLLVNLSNKLNSEFETEITMITVENKFNPDRPPIFFSVSRSDPIVSLYDVRGKTIKHNEQNSGKQPTQTIKNFNRLPDKILIRDSNSLLSKSGNGLTDGIAGMSRFTPTIVGYINREGNRKLLISLPEELDVTTFWKTYRKALKKVHEDFFGKTYRRPKDKDHKIELLKEIWVKKHLDKKKITEQIKTLSNRMMRDKHELLAPNTIRRHYLPVLRRRRRDNN